MTSPRGSVHFELRPLERALGLVFGKMNGVSALPWDGSLTPREALEAILLDALAKPPCLMSFSGGRDSSALLAVAVKVARREGLPLPVPATLVFPEAAQSQESEWQETVLSHLSVTERVIIEGKGDDFDAIGPLAQEVLRTHGLLWPFNVHFHLPIVKAAEGGSVVTGFGGDELALSSTRLWAENLIVQRRIRKPRQLLIIAEKASPAPMRFFSELRKTERDILSKTPWLTTAGRALVLPAYSASESVAHLGWGRQLRHEFWRTRYFQATVQCAQIMALPYDVRMVHPFLEPRLLQALAAGSPFNGLGNRDALMQTLFSDVLPKTVVKRSSKATFGSALWTETTRDFAKSWTGRGLDERLVDPEVLRNEWPRPTVNSYVTTLLQQAWLATTPSAHDASA